MTDELGQPSSEHHIQLLEMKIRELTCDLETARLHSKMKSDFLATMSHELRTPLSGIMGMVKLLEDTNLDKEQEEYVYGISRASDNLLALLNDILDLSKVESGKLTLESIAFDLQVTIEETCNMLSAKAHEKGIELLTRFSADLNRFLIGDPGRIRQIVINLVGNAIKFTHEGFVLISASSIVEGQKAKLKIQVEDTGIGIDKEKLNTMFEEFTQAADSTTRLYGGTGLGLSISKKLIESMGAQ